jgi:hypothetical protein
MKLAVKFGTTQIVILALTLITAVIHLTLPGALFKLNGLGYLGLIALYFIDFSFIPVPRSWVRWVLVGYAALTIILYVVMQIQSNGEFVSPLGIFTKLVELVLIVLLIREPSQAG